MTAQIGTPSDQGELLANASSPGVNAQSNKYETQLMLFQTIPIKTVQVDVVKETKVIPCGTPFGIKMFTNGVVVVGTADIDTPEKNRQSSFGSWDQDR